MGRWQNGRSWDDGDGWRTVRNSRSNSQAGNRQRTGSRGRSEINNSELQQENRRLKDKLAAAERAKTIAHDRTPHPGAVERPREGDWMCANLSCGFASNRHARLFCYRCTQPRADSFPAASGGGAASPTLSSPTTPATSLRPGQSPSSSAPPPPGQEHASPQDKIKALKAKLELLKSARALYEGNAECATQLRKCDDDIADTQTQLSSVVPVEVAVKSTIAPAPQARAALQKAETKLARLEAHVVGAVAAYDAAAAEVDDCRQKLAAAEAATARAAASSLPHSDLVAAMARDPAAAWEAMLSSIEVRTPGMPEGLLQHLRATTTALKQLCALLPVEPTAGPSTSTAHTAAPANGAVQSAPPAPAAAAPALQSASPSASDIGLGAQQLPPQQDAPVAPAGEHSVQPSVEELQLQLRAAQEHAHAQELQLATLRAAAATSSIGNSGTAALQPSAPGVPSQFEAVAAAAAAAEASDQSTLSESTVVAPLQSSTTGAAVVQEAAPHQMSQAQPAPNAGLPAVGDAADDLTPSVDVSTNQPIAQAMPRDDDMGGGAPNGVARKRAADALEAARGLAAKAKAKSKAQ